MNYTDFVMKCFTNSCVMLHTFDLRTQELIFIASDNPKIPLKQPLDLQFVEDIFFNTDNDTYIEYYFKELLTSSYKRIAEMHMSTDQIQNSRLHFRRVHYSKTLWTELNFIVSPDYSEENPLLLVYATNCTPTESKYMDFQLAVEETFISINRLNLATYKISTIHKYLARDYIQSSIEEIDMKERVTLAEKSLVFQDDWDIINEYTSQDFLKNYFKYNNSHLAFFYRRKVGNIFIWAKCTILKAFDYSEENPILLLYVTDINLDVLRYIALSSRYQYELLMERKNVGISEVFYNDILNLLNLLTQPYLFYITIDIDADVYLSFKTNNIFHNPYETAAASFTEAITQYVNHFYSKEEAETILGFMSLENIRNQLTTNAVMKLEFIDKNGDSLLATVSRLDMKNGVPHRVLMTITSNDSPSARLKIKTFGNFEVFDIDGNPLKFEKKASKEVLAYMIDKKGYPVCINDIILDVLEKNVQDLNAKKYASGLLRKAMKDLTAAGYPNVIIEEKHIFRINTSAVNCDYYHLINGDISYLQKYNNEYMKEYSWAEETNSDLLDLL